MMPAARIAIVSANTLEAVGLESVLNELLPECEVCVFTSFGDLQTRDADAEPAFFHYFVAAQQVMEHCDFFLLRQRRTIVLAPSTMSDTLFGHFHRLDCTLPEKQLVKAILRLNSRGHGEGMLQTSPARRMGHIATDASATMPISPREAEVLALVVKGCINKEIADRLCISPTTVITHRKNICEKLRLRSVSSLTIYAVTHGIVRLDEI